MAKKMYSWTTFPLADHPKDFIRPGDVVSRGDFDDLDDNQFNDLCAIGAIRDIPYPIPQRDDGTFVHDGSPREYALAQIAEMNDQQYEASVVNTWNDPNLQRRAREAMDEAGYDETDADEDTANEQEFAESRQATRVALGSAGAGKPPARPDKAAAEKEAKDKK